MEFILFAQHGWADDNRAMINLAKQVAADSALIVAPSLGYIQTWIRIKPLIHAVERMAIEQMHRHPDDPVRIIGHSMGGLIWLEVLHRHPEWWARVHSLILVASPVAGADLGRLIDPLNMGIGIARDLGTNRESIAETIAAQIPTLVIAGDIDGGSDGTVNVECTKFAKARFICLQGLSHAVLRDHALVAETICDFWEDTTIGESIAYDEIIQRLHQIPGFTAGHWRDFHRAETIIHLYNGGTIRTWTNPVGIDHVFVACPEGKCLCAGFVGWFHAQDLQFALREIQKSYSRGVMGHR